MDIVGPHAVSALLVHWNICLRHAQHSTRPERNCTRCGWTIQSCSPLYMPPSEKFWSLLQISLSSLYLNHSPSQISSVISNPMGTIMPTNSHTWQELSHLTCTENTKDWLNQSMTPPSTRYGINLVLIHFLFQLWEVTASAWLQLVTTQHNQGVAPQSLDAGL